MINRFTVLICVLMVLFGGCKKKSKPAEEETPAPLTPNATPPPALLINVPADADGVFWASVIPYKFPSTNFTNLGNASAFIYTSPTNRAYVDGGVVKSNDSIIPKVSGGSYFFYGTPIDGQSNSGINFQDTSRWQIAGNASTGVPSFTFNNGGVPNFSNLVSDNHQSRTHPFNALINSFGVTDSVVLILSADSSAVKKTAVAGFSVAVQFSISEMAGVRKQISYTQGTLTIIAYKMTSVMINNKKYYFINSSTSSSTVYIGP